MAQAGECPFRVGETFEKVFSLDADSISRFATMAGDTNPLHHDLAAARQSQFGNIIASGAQSVSLLTATTASIVTARSASVGLEVSYRFRRAVMADEKLRMIIEVTGIEPKAGKGHVVIFAGTLFNEKGEAAVTGQSKALLFSEGH